MIVTNGAMETYKARNDYKDFLRDIGIRQFQMSLDGLEETHEKVLMVYMKILQRN